MAENKKPEETLEKVMGDRTMGGFGAVRHLSRHSVSGKKETSGLRAKKDYDPKILSATHREISEGLKHRDPKKRVEAISHPHASEHHLHTALKDRNHEVKTAAISHKNVNHKHLARAMKQAAKIIAQNPHKEHPAHAFTRAVHGVLRRFRDRQARADKPKGEKKVRVTSQRTVGAKATPKKAAPVSSPPPVKEKKEEVRKSMPFVELTKDDVLSYMWRCYRGRDEVIDLNIIKEFENNGNLPKTLADRLNKEIGLPLSSAQEEPLNKAGAMCKESSHFAPSTPQGPAAAGTRYLRATRAADEPKSKESTKEERDAFNKPALDRYNKQKSSNVNKNDEEPYTGPRTTKDIATEHVQGVLAAGKKLHTDRPSGGGKVSALLVSDTHSGPGRPKKEIPGANKLSTKEFHAAQGGVKKMLKAGWKARKLKKADSIDLPFYIKRYEKSDLGKYETNELFQVLVDTGLVHHLGDEYKNKAIELIKSGDVFQETLAKSDSQYPLSKEELLDTMEDMFRNGEEPQWINKSSIARLEYTGMLDSYVHNLVLRHARVYAENKLEKDNDLLNKALVAIKGVIEEARAGTEKKS